MRSIPAPIVNVLGLSVLAIIESMHALIVIAAFFNFFPPQVDPAVVSKYFPFLFSAMRPERELLFYRLWIGLAFGLQAFIMFWFRRQLDDPLLLGRMRNFILTEAVFLFILVFCVFKGLLYGDPAWVKALFYSVLAGSVMVRIFWPESCRWAPIGIRFIKSVLATKAGPWLIIALIVLFIFPVDINAVMARVFIQERFHHFDAFVMSAGWALRSGNILNVDNICQYGIGMTHLISAMSNIIGGFSYQNVLWIFVGMTIIYFIGIFMLTRWWLGSLALAGAGIFLCIKFQMFHWGVAPVIWEFLSATIVRYFFDALFLFFVLHHLRFGTWGLWAACLCSGMALAYMVDTGVYLWLAFLTYLLFTAWDKKRWILFSASLLPVVIAFVILYVLAGPAVLRGEFWRNGMEQANLFLNGWGTLPIYQNLKEGNYFAFWMGLFIPLAYVFTIIWALAAYVLGDRRGDNIFALVISVYGLGLYHYYICRSAHSSYHAVDIPFVMVLGFWVKEIAARWPGQVWRGVRAGIFLLALGALLTNYLFSYYPNVLNLARYDASKEKAFYAEGFQFNEDARFIQQRTSPEQKVALISSFETKILMDAGRKPFFFYFPLIFSSFMASDTFSGIFLYTFDRVERTIGQLKVNPKQKVYVEAKLFNRRLPPKMYKQNTALSMLMDYCHDHYRVTGQGRYIIELSPKGEPS